MADLDTLRPEVLDLLAGIEGEYPEARTIRAELLRLTNENVDYAKHAIEQYSRGVYWMDRAKDAESELAALKARIAEAPSISTEAAASLVGAELHERFKGKRVRLVVEE